MSGYWVCQLCWKRVHKQRNGAWYHDRTSSESCRPGDGSGQKAVPVRRESRPRCKSCGNEIDTRGYAMCCGSPS